MKKIPWFWFDHRADLPQWLFAAIGKIAVEWSILERELEELIRLAADMPLKSGRIATLGMNIRTRLNVASGFLQARVYQGSIDPQFLAEFIKLHNQITKKLEGRRNLMVHGLWDKRKDGWRVLETRGSRPTPMLQPDLEKLSRSVIPNSEKVTKESMEKIVQDIVKATDDVIDLCERLEVALSPLQHKSPPYTRRRHQPHARTKRTP